MTEQVSRAELEAHHDVQQRRWLVAALKEVRLANGLSQSEVARRMGTTQPVISDLERGGRDSTIKYLQDYARACGAQLRVGIEPKIAMQESPCTERDSHE